MFLPLVQYGDWGTVRRRMVPVVKQLVRGAPLNEVMCRDGLVDSSKQSGLIVLSGVMPGSVSSFYSCMPWRDVWEKMFDLQLVKTSPSQLENEMFEASLATSWGVLGLMGSDCREWLLPRERHEPFLNAALDVWSELDSVGARYYVALEGRSLWSVSNNLHYVLAHMGVPGEVLRSPLPDEGPRGLLRYRRSFN